MRFLTPSGRATAHRFQIPSLILCTLAAQVPVVQAQTAATDNSETLSDVIVTSIRVEKPVLKIPAAVSAVQQDDIQLGRQQLGIDESLNSVPGLFFQDRLNFAQDLRVSIRGFGARSNFGIRGIRIYSDGIPLTSPDGQSNVDEVDIGSTDRIEVIRSASSSLYGASSGGVINLYTEDGPETPFVQGRFSYGSYDFQNDQLKSGGQWQRFNYLLNLSHLNLDGFRDHAKVESNGLNSKFRYDIDPSSSLTLTMNGVHQPISNDPGALTATEALANRTQASGRNLAYDAGETVDQQKLGLLYRKHVGEKHEIQLRNYYLWRDFENKLPAGGTAAQCPGFFTPELGCSENNSAWVEFDRFLLGGGAQYIYTDVFLGHRNRFTAGFDIDAQKDDRRRFDNLVGGTRGMLRFDQIEAVMSHGFYVRDEFTVLDGLELTAGARYDVVDYDFEDHFLGNGDDSDEVDFDQASPTVGLVWSPLEALNLYGNVSTAFETPSTTEFANPAGTGSAGGLNQGLRPQTSLSYEMGVKGLIHAPADLRYELAFFHINTEDELVPFTVTGAPLGRSFLENAEEATRDGVESALAWQIFPGLIVSGSYTYSDFEYENFRSATGCAALAGICDGKAIPGVPRRLLSGRASYFHSSGFYARFDILYVGRFFANNVNNVENMSYRIANLRVGRDFQRAQWLIAPYLGLNNLFDKEYNGNVRINVSNASNAAVVGRFFEPAPPLEVYGGVTVRRDF